jgi:hypothetical protein
MALRKKDARFPSKPYGILAQPRPSTHPTATAFNRDRLSLMLDDYILAAGSHFVRTPNGYS